MVVHDLDLGRARGGPPETDPVLVVDPDGMLTGAIAARRFQTIAGGTRSCSNEIAAFKTVSLSRARCTKPAGRSERARFEPTPWYKSLVARSAKSTARMLSGHDNIVKR
jgi:hypothetical protein